MARAPKPASEPFKLDPDVTTLDFPGPADEPDPDRLEAEDLSHAFIADDGTFADPADEPDPAPDDGAAETRLPLQIVSVARLKDHPRNYRTHPPDQLAHIQESLRLHGLYRNIVVARDDTILAGHGVVQAIRGMGWLQVPVLRRDLDPMDPIALKLLAGDNQIAQLAEIQDRQLTEMLKEIRDSEAGLLGTGYDEMMLANLLFVTRPESEIATRDEAAHWVGMPEYDNVERPLQVLLSFETAADRDALMTLAGIVDYRHRESRVWTAWYPNRPQDDTSSLRFEA